MAKVLLVEDDNNLREIFEMRLIAEGYQVSTASDGEEALVTAMKEKPDLIVADVMMPKLSGFEMLENLKAVPEMANTKTIMMTALGQAEDRARGEKLGVVKYLVKSQVTLEDFVRVIREVLGGGSTNAAAQPAANQASGSPAVTSTTTNQVKESESSMQDDSQSTNQPPAGGDSGMGQGMPSNPISTPGLPDSSAPGSDAMNSSQEQGAVQSQINNFASSPAGGDQATAGAPSGDSGSMDSPMPGSSDTSMGGPATPPQTDAPGGDNGAGSNPMPSGDSGPAMPAGGDSAPSGDGSQPSTPPSSDPSSGAL